MGGVLGGSWVCSWPIRTNVQQRPSQHRRVLILQSMCVYICILGTSLVVQGVRLHLPAQGVGVQSLVRDHVPQSQKTKTEQKNIVTSSIKTLKMVHNDNNNKNLKKKEKSCCAKVRLYKKDWLKVGPIPSTPCSNVGVPAGPDAQLQLQRTVKGSRARRLTLPTRCAMHASCHGRPECFMRLPVHSPGFMWKPTVLGF